MISIVVVTRNRKDDVVKCLASIFSQSYKSTEVILVDNASTDDTVRAVHKKFPKLKIVASKENVGAAKGRNLGLAKSKGNIILFLDDDTKAHPKMVEELANVLTSSKEIGVVQPKIYEMGKDKMLQGVGHDINLLTGRVIGIGVHVKDKGQFEDVMEIPMAGCTWMVKREVFKKIGGYDEDFFIPYEDSDFSLRARRAGYKIYYVPSAMIWHKGVKVTTIDPRLEWIGITTPERAYRVSRNKIIFMRKHASFPNLLIFLFFFIPLYTLAHSLIVLSSRRLDILFDYWKGLFSGFYYTIRTDNMRRYMDKVELKLIAWGDPVCKIIDKSAESILDVGCGEGDPMKLIKIVMSPKYVVGVDLFKKYVTKARKEKIHDRYIISDIRKIKFPARSFDVVLASHVIEHLPEKDAYELIKKLERFAKKQVIIATPIGEMYHPAVDGNKLQLHLSHFHPKDFRKLNYQVLKYGRKSILGEEGLVHKIKLDPLKKLIYLLNILITPLFYRNQALADYVFVAYKNIK